jgi:methylamine dehydrogenase light chain
MRHLDDRVTEFARRFASRSSRRGFLGWLGTTLLGVVGVSAFPLLPVRRAFALEPAPADPSVELPEGNPEACSYWRYCAIDGFLSSCCGGTHTTCTPGTQMSPVTWLGTCRNPEDGKHYVISYNDCCGKDLCGKCFCNRHEGDRPVYVTPKSNDINWCLGTPTVVYNSTVAVVVGVASEPG